MHASRLTETVKSATRPSVTSCPKRAEHEGGDPLKSLRPCSLAAHHRNKTRRWITVQTERMDFSYIQYDRHKQAWACEQTRKMLERPGQAAAGQ